jgi:hypothetical protein
MPPDGTLRVLPQLTQKATSHNPEVAGSNPAPATEKGPQTRAFCNSLHLGVAKVLPNFCLAGRSDMPAMYYDQPPTPSGMLRVEPTDCAQPGP